MNCSEDDNPIDVFSEVCRRSGFIAVGFSRSERPMFLDHFRKWLEGEKHADMAWLSRHAELRAEPAGLLEGCRTIISLAYPYSTIKPSATDGLTTARFSEPLRSDYHSRLKGIAAEAVRCLGELFPGSTARVCVDSAPILERSFAWGSGIGFIGKNNSLIIPGYGSFFYLVEILTTAFLPAGTERPMENQCGECTLCLEACPTGALEKAFWLDASRCLSYRSIEFRGSVEAEIAEKMGGCFFGCDVCQEVCPFNKTVSADHVCLPSAGDILGMDTAGFQAVFGGTVFARAGIEKVKDTIRAIQACRRV